MKTQPGTGSKTKRVFIGGLKTTTTSDTLLEYFSQFGHVEFVDLPEDKGSQRRRGFGYVAFDDYDPVDKVTSKLLLVDVVYELYNADMFTDSRECSLFR